MPNQSQKGYIFLTLNSVFDRGYLHTFLWDIFFYCSTIDYVFIIIIKIDK